MVLTQENYRQIQDWLRDHSIKTSEFKDAILPLGSNEEISFVQKGKDVKMKLSDLINVLAAKQTPVIINNITKEINICPRIILSEKEMDVLIKEGKVKNGYDYLTYEDD